METIITFLKLCLEVQINMRKSTLTSTIAKYASKPSNYAIPIKGQHSKFDSSMRNTCTWAYWEKSLLIGRKKTLDPTRQVNKQTHIYACLRGVVISKHNEDESTYQVLYWAYCNVIKWLIFKIWDLDTIKLKRTSTLSNAPNMDSWWPQII